MRKISVIFLLITIFYSCTRSGSSAFELLKNLEGTWKSTGNIVVFDSWEKNNDSTLTGKRFSVLNNDTVFINDFELALRKNKVVLFLKKMKFKTVEAGRNEIKFENTASKYPERIIVEYPFDSVYKFREENIRGNKVIEFEMKRVK